MLTERTEEDRIEVMADGTIYGNSARVMGTITYHV